MRKEFRFAKTEAMQEKMKSLVRMTHFIMKLSRRIRPNLGESELELKPVPEDVKKGHFAVLAGNGDEKKRFVVALNHLKNPEFLRLLEKAQDEYGFDHAGLLAVPCSFKELEKILQSGI